MHDLMLLIAHVLSMLVRLAGTGGVRSVIAESALLKHQLLIVNRPRHRAPNLRVTDRFIVAVCSLFIRPARLVRSAIILRLWLANCKIRPESDIFFSCTMCGCAT